MSDDEWDGILDDVLQKFDKLAKSMERLTHDLRKARDRHRPVVAAAARYVVYVPYAKAWWLAPDKSLTQNAAEAHIYTAQEIAAMQPLPEKVVVFPYTRP